MNARPGGRVGLDELIRLAGEDGTVVYCSRCDRALGTDGRCSICGTGVAPAQQPEPAAQEPLAFEIEELGAIDVRDLSQEGEDAPADMVIEALQIRGGILVLTGEEGEGKTLAADQLCRQLVRGDQIFGMFAPGTAQPTRVLFVDTEQEKPEARRRAAEMKARGLETEAGSMLWSTAGALELDRPEDQKRLLLELERIQADYLWIDSGSNALLDGKDDASVRPFFAFLSELMRSHGLVGIGLTLHPRKRGQGDWTRRFDDLFGSREFKGRTTTALYLDGNKVICWKDRTGQVRQAWPARVGGKYPVAKLERPGLEQETVPPFVIVPEAPEEAIDTEEVERRAIELVESEPDHYSKSSLANAIKGKRQDVLSVVERLLADGFIGPDKHGARLRITAKEPEQETLSETA